MWKKTLRKGNGLSYRKKFKCPVCMEYNLYIIHDSACECISGCETDNFNIQEIMSENDFSEYYSSKEIKDCFFIDDEECNKVFKEIFANSIFHLLPDREKNEIETFFGTASKFDESLDDIVVDYLNMNCLKELPDLNPFGYIVNLVEDIHFYVNLCCKDIVLFDSGVEFTSRGFFSGRFFYNNAVEHLFQANERMFVFLGIFYGFDFDRDLETNRTYKIERFLKKNDKYKISQFKVVFERLKGNNFYNVLKEMRDFNTHDISYLAKTINEDLEVNGDKVLEFWNRDGNECDRDFYLPKMKNLIFFIGELYKFINQILVELKGNRDIYSISDFPMFRKYFIFDDSIVLNNYETKNFDELDRSNRLLFSRLHIYKDQRICDIFFRMGEVIHCIADSGNISIREDMFYARWRSEGLELVGLIDEQYLLYSALIRLYSCYEKFTRYIAQSDSKYSEIQYFENFRMTNINDKVIERISVILDDDNYKLLFKLRNDIYHNLRAGCLYGDKGLEYYNLVLFKIVFENTKLLYNLIYDLVDFPYRLAAIKVGRNEACPCGSGIKFKKCCGTR